MGKKSLLLILSLFAIIVILMLIIWTDWLDKIDITLHKSELQKIDVTKVDFEYNVDVCNEYFNLVECIIDKDTDERYTEQMRIDLKNEVKQIQEEWKKFGEEELTIKCTEELARFDNEEMKNYMKSFGCFIR